MFVKHSHLLEVRQLKDNKVVLCYIQIASRPIQYFLGQTSHETYRWMQVEDWARFDAILEMMFDNQVRECRPDKIPEHTFQLNASIRVRVSQSRIPVGALQRCILNASTQKQKPVFALEFFIEFKEPEFVKAYHRNLVGEEKENNHEYEPQFISSQQDGAHVPYTPSPKTKPNSDPNKEEDFLERTDDDVYTPHPVSIDNSSKNCNKHSPKIPAYKPSSTLLETRSESTEIQAHVSSNKNDKKESNRNKERAKSKQKKLYFEYDNKHQSNNKMICNEKDQRLKERKSSSQNEDFNLSGERKSNRKHHDDQMNEMKVEMEKKHKNTIDFTEKLEGISYSPTHQEKRKRNSKNSEDASSVQLRRSSRSPIKPKRLIEENFEDAKIEIHCETTPSESPKRSKMHLHKLNEDLFGSVDDDFDNKSEYAEQNISTKAKSSQHPKALRKNAEVESAKKRRKHSSSQDCASEKHHMDKWLSKKITTKVTATTTRISTSSPSVSCASKRKSSNDCTTYPPSSASTSFPITYLSKEVIEENMKKEKAQLEKNSKLKEILQEMAGPIPEKVETLNIKDLSLEEILNSFDRYKPQLDDIFRRNKKKAQLVKGYGHIDNYMVMSLIDKNKPLDMMNKLQDAYEPDCEGAPSYTTIFANAMMPEWIIRLFMDKHKLTREEALQHVKAQEEYQLHVKSLIENNIAE